VTLELKLPESETQISVCKYNAVTKRAKKVKSEAAKRTGEIHYRIKQGHKQKGSSTLLKDQFQVAVNETENSF